MRTTIIGAVIFCTAMMIGCGNDQTSQAQIDDTPPYIVAVNNPLLYFTRRLIGNEVEVQLLVPADTDPASWQPAVDAVLQLQGAELVLLNGAGYSGWLDKVSISTNKLLVTSEAANEQWIALDGEVTHSHGPGGEHAHGGYAFTTWMDMSLAQVHADAIAASLQLHWPEHGDAIATNLRSLSKDLSSLDQAYREQAERLAGRSIIFSHPVYQYFARRYNLPGHSLHWEPDAMPTDRQWAELEQRVNVSSLFVWEGAPLPAILDKMTSLGLESVVIEPGANIGQNSWLDVQQSNMARMAEIVAQDP